MHGITRAIRAALGTAIAAATLGAHADPTIAASPAIASYGQPVTIQLHDAQPYFLPATRFTRSGNTIVAEYEAFASSFGPFPPNVGAMPLTIGELPPGNYTVTARVLDVDDPTRVIGTSTSSLPVLPPSEYGVYPVPKEPNANQDVSIAVRSAAYFDPHSLQVSFNTRTIRVDFVYGTPPAGAGWQTWGSISVGQLPAGTWHVEGWARAATGGPSDLYFTRDFNVAPPVVVVEYYNEWLDHYFMTQSGNEIALLDAGGQGGWKRTGQTFKAWANASDAPPQAKPVCRFYAKGPNSHFYTADANECEQLKQLESAGRAQAAGNGTEFLGWGYEGIAFYALAPDNGQCAPGAHPVWRSYNDRALQNDSNHRFTVDSQVRDSMAGWTLEGLAFCAAP